ncbi:MAG: hypothetical protein QOI63_982 [Thermoplasmata archaeon]|jgi:hypothetical protein|nr:hypothetical protein [Thermoplasmata archaeon]
MGEYFRHRGGTGHKLGTQDDWRYVRLDEVRRDLRHATNPETLQDGLKDPSTLYRFPWPDEDHDDRHAIQRRSMFRTDYLLIPPDLAHIFGSFHHTGTCPNGSGKGPPLDCLATIYGERVNADGARTIFRCGYCAAPFSMAPDDVARLQAKDPSLVRQRLKANHGGA